MRGYLIDTSILSEVAPERAQANIATLRFLERQGGQAYLASMTVAEIAKGIAKLRRVGATTRALLLSDWLESIEAGFAERILPFDTRVAKLAGQMDDAATASGRHPGLGDIVIASTAAAHDLTIATANLRHFEALGVAAINPTEL